MGEWATLREEVCTLRRFANIEDDVIQDAWEKLAGALEGDLPNVDIHKCALDAAIAAAEVYGKWLSPRASCLRDVAAAVTQAVYYKMFQLDELDRLRDLQKAVDDADRGFTSYIAHLVHANKESSPPEDPPETGSRI